VCGDRQLLFEEAPSAYKRIDHVIADLVAYDLATPIATTIPMITYKTPDLGSVPQRDRRDPRRRRGRP
jgi:release factor H-coupled RctB family protein